ncbi:phosphoribosylformylglycinamidine synthase subunit PurS [Candidatus Roizmanbacteria bacterium]|nr:phosphoribosylformylglycinamidine synthase subunit PurS [Candidatus Roizmanbacteria bacterium]
MSPEYKVGVTVSTKKGILQPDANAVHKALGSLGFDTVTGVRMEKLIRLIIDAPNAVEARKIAKDATEKLLRNPVLEDYRITSATLVKPEQKK